MIEAHVHVDRWHRFACRQMYVCTLELDVCPEVRDTFDFRWTDLGTLFAVVDDFGDLVPIDGDELRWLRLYWRIDEMDVERFDERYQKDSSHEPPWKNYGQTL